MKPVKHSNPKPSLIRFKYLIKCYIYNYMYNGIGVAKLQWVIAKLQMGLRKANYKIANGLRKL